jgi:hypothetical protein
VLVSMGNAWIHRLLMLVLMVVVVGTRMIMGECWARAGAAESCSCRENRCISHGLFDSMILGWGESISEGGQWPVLVPLLH